MDHNYVRDEENEEEIMRVIWGKAHPDDGGEDAGDGTNAGEGTNAGDGTDAGREGTEQDDDDFTSQFLICGEGLDSTERNDEVPIY